MDFRGIDEAIAYAQQRWPGLELRADGRDSASGPCPFENQGNDRFVVSVRGHYFCRQCNAKGWLDEENQQHLSTEQRQILALQAEAARAKREREAIKSRLTALERLAYDRPDQRYHEMLREEDRQWWYSQGIYKDAIEEYNLGVCFSCPTDKEHRASYTIPVMDSKWEQLLNVQHRLIGAKNGNKYRPEHACLGVQLFNARHVLNHREIGLVEGAKKSIVLTQHGFPACGFPGITTFQESWLRHFRGVKRIWLGPDPGAEDEMAELGKRIAKLTGIRVAQITLWQKPDDFFVEGGTEAEFKAIVGYARRVA